MADDQSYSKLIDDFYEKYQHQFILYNNKHNTLDLKYLDYCVPEQVAFLRRNEYIDIIENCVLGIIDLEFFWDKFEIMLEEDKTISQHIIYAILANNLRFDVDSKAQPFSKKLEEVKIECMKSNPKYIFDEYNEIEQLSEKEFIYAMKQHLKNLL